MHERGKNLPASINARLQNLARSQGKPFQEVVQYYGIERFLYRLSKTDYGHLFVLKGGLIFYALGFSLRRATRDIDFRGFTQNSTENLINIVVTACNIRASNDGIVYKLDSIRAEEINIDANYRGVRISLLALLGSAKIPLRIDVGFSDLITPDPNDIRYPVLLSEMESPNIRIYPPESIISEKFQAMVRLVDINSRWKDFYDIWMLSELNNFEGQLLQSAISVTFRKRETPLPLAIPIGLTDGFADGHQKQWETFLSRSKLVDGRIKNFASVIGRLRLFLLPLVQAATKNESFDKKWVAGSDWH